MLYAKICCHNLKRLFFLFFCDLTAVLKVFIDFFWTLQHFLRFSCKNAVRYEKDYGIHIVKVMNCEWLLLRCSYCYSS